MMIIITIIEIPRRGRKSNKIQEKQVMPDPFSQQALTSLQPVPPVYTPSMALWCRTSLLASLGQWKAWQAPLHESRAVASLINPVGSAEETSWDALAAFSSAPTPNQGNPWTLGLLLVAAVPCSGWEALEPINTL